MLKARGRNPPCAFWRADMDACHVGYIRFAIQASFLNRHQMMLKDRPSRHSCNRKRHTGNPIASITLKAISNGKRSAAEDHVSSLREDPSYFVESLKELMDHRYDHVKDTYGIVHPHLHSGREKLVGAPVISNVVASADYYLEVWTKLYGLMEENEETFTQRDPDEEMPKDVQFDTAVRKLLSPTRYLQRLGEWVEPTADKNAVAATQNEVDEAARRPLSELYFDLERRTERTLARNHADPHQHAHGHGHHHTHTKTKPKTRGTPAAQPDHDPPAAAAAGTSASALPDAQPTFHLDARALKVFRTLCFTPYISSTPDEVPWAGFLHAMAATGFVPEKLYGSVWNFRPTGLDVERSIQIHEPHPSGKIPDRHCRRHGRRFGKAYGWHGGMFRGLEKEEKV
ncbi:hypothetical protein EJ03DRAFT_381702 [Teratosphaeria nubilosa]|uniref:Uncharacterized protein n=1 Tax=Teratosphaeria nubilosa TaxID=161662 RepID=A0A6G1LFK6_9PEZI|nr:hypothetical protein EJ03DRAFT_381702 [Teratosphaeria nubilosa]